MVNSFLSLADLDSSAHTASCRYWTQAIACELPSGLFRAKPTCARCSMWAASRETRFHSPKPISCPMQAGRKPSPIATLYFTLHRLSFDRAQHEDELIIPAREGALRVLRASKNAGVKRVVLTSSFAAIGYGHENKDRPFSETDWTDPNGSGVTRLREIKDSGGTRSMGFYCA